MANLLTCDFFDELAFDSQKGKRNRKKPNRKSPRFQGLPVGIGIRHAGWLPDDVASIDEEVDAGHE